MKKYHQLLLLIISVISLSLFLVYRHEYNRLHYVLEVFNFFGQPCNISGTEVTENVLSHHDWGSIPIWQENGNVYLYSAFWTNKNEVKAIAVQTDDSALPRNCYLWFENKKKPVVGKYKFSKIAQDDASKEAVYFYYCSLLNSHHIPYAVSFGAKGKKATHLSRILLTNTQLYKPSINTTICVSPTTFVKSDFIEFLSFHVLIGVDTFIFYGGNIPHRLTKIITNLSHRLNINTAYFPFNYPNTNDVLTRIIVENDCNLRNINQSNYVTTLELNEYIVPTSMYSFNEILKNFNTKSERLSLPVEKFCIKNMNQHKPIALQNTEVVYDNEKLVNYIYRNKIDNEVITTQVVDRGFASIHKYINCNQIPQKTYIDNSILRFSTDFTRTTLVQLLLHNQL